MLPHLQGRSEWSKDVRRFMLKQWREIRIANQELRMVER
jgi:hypothetical protein